jgi:hypothetical protein
MKSPLSTRSARKPDFSLVREDVEKGGSRRQDA